MVYTLAGGLQVLLSSCWHDNIHKVKESLLSLFCYSFKALGFWFGFFLCMVYPYYLMAELPDVGKMVVHHVSVAVFKLQKMSYLPKDL